MKRTSSAGKNKKIVPAISPEARENQMISLAVDLAERQLMEGTASAQVITHYLKLATIKEKREREKLEEEITLLKARTENIKRSERTEEFYEKVLKEMRRYSGKYNEEEDDDYDDEDI